MKTIPILIPGPPALLTTAGICFPEGLVYFKNRWFMHYGTADEQIAVAVK